MKPKDVASDLFGSLRRNAGEIPRRIFIGQLVDILVPYLQQEYPGAADLEAAIMAGRPVLDQALATVPVDGLAAARMVASSVAQNTTVADYDSILAGIGQQLPDHEAVLFRHPRWYVASMERARAWFLGMGPPGA